MASEHDLAQRRSQGLTVASRDLARRALSDIVPDEPCCLVLSEDAKDADAMRHYASPMGMRVEWRIPDLSRNVWEDLEPPDVAIKYSKSRDGREPQDPTLEALAARRQTATVLSKPCAAPDASALLDFVVSSTGQRTFARAILLGAYRKQRDAVRAAMPMRLLLVQDETTLLEFWALVLKPLGLSIVTARHAGEALEWFGREKFDLVNTNYCMPGGKGGDELIRDVHEFSAGRIPCVLNSGCPWEFVPPSPACWFEAMPLAHGDILASAQAAQELRAAILHGVRVGNPVVRYLE